MASSRILSPYHNWTREELIARLHKVDSEYTSHTKSEQQADSFNFSAHSRRKIALKFCYSGSEYNGLAFQKDYTPLPTVEGVLFDALARTRLIDPDAGFEGCGWERCGRTDRGVSAAGQVISLWVRSAIEKTSVQINNLLTTETYNLSTLEPDEESPPDDLPLMEDLDPPFSSCVKQNEESVPEIAYIQVLNRVLPPTIRILCWSPVSESFSARFSCQFRHYKYFFPASAELSIPRMQDAAARLVGAHDFRNLCTLDGSKQIENYIRRVKVADISQVGHDESVMGVGPMYVLDLVGNAFLYNQVRSIMAILFLVGIGLEDPHVVSSLMNADPENPLPPFHTGEAIEVVDRKPSYQMADGLPLVLWNCGYSESEVQWQTDDDGSSSSANKESAMTTNVRHQLLSLYTRSRIRASLDSHFLQAAANHHVLPFTPLPLSSQGDKDALINDQKTILNIPVGGGSHIRTAKYKPLLTRERGESSSVVNERWRQGRGKKRWEERLARQGQGQGDDVDE